MSHLKKFTQVSIQLKLVVMIKILTKLFHLNILNTLNPSSVPSHKLRLRKHAVVMLIRNLNISEDLCNETRLLVSELGNNLLKCKILNGDKTDDIVFLNRITLYCEDEYPFTFKRRQFPVKKHV